MNIRNTAAATVIALALITAAGCAVTRGQQTVGAYVDDTAITTATVMLSGFAKSESEKSNAEALARKVDGVKSVKNELAVRP
jgi:hyperosmotically inducible periplasmic protein